MSRSSPGSRQGRGVRREGGNELLTHLPTQDGMGAAGDRGGQSCSHIARLKTVRGRREKGGRR